MRICQYDLPAHWASSLINEDDTGNSDEDDAEIAEWLAARPELGACLTCSDNPTFRHHHDAPGVLPCSCLTFDFPVKE